MHSSAAEATAGAANPAIPITATAITATPNLRTTCSFHDTNISAGVQATLKPCPTTLLSWHGESFDFPFCLLGILDIRRMSWMRPLCMAEHHHRARQRVWHGQVPT